MAMRPIVQILNYNLSELTIVNRDAFDPMKPPACQLEAQFRVEGDETEQGVFRTTLTIRVHEEGMPNANPPYDLKATISGAFGTVLKTEPKAVPGVAVLNALTLLYGVLRGDVAQLSGSFPNQRFILPTVTFENLVLKASKNPASGVVAPQAEIGSPAKAFFTMQVSLETLRSLMGLLPEAVGPAVVDAFGDLTGAMDGLATDQPEAVASVSRTMERLKESVGAIPSSELRVVIETLLGQVRPALEAALRAQVELESDGSSAAESPGETPEQAGVKG